MKCLFRSKSARQLRSKFTSGDRIQKQQLNGVSLIDSVAGLEEERSRSNDTGGEWFQV